MSDKSQAQVMLLMLKGALLEASEEERKGVLDAVVRVKALAKELAGDSAILAVAIANLEMTLEAEE